MLFVDVLPAQVIKYPLGIWVIWDLPTLVNRKFLPSYIVCFMIEFNKEFRTILVET
jgi:hypothetical protein